MDTKRLYVDFHVLQTVPPSCVNRDDTGSPKTAVYGGAVRARVSSQAWKHAMRVMFTEEMSDAVETGYRTKKGTDLVAEQIAALAPDSDALKLAQKVIADAGIKSDDKGTKALFFMSTAQAKALAELAVEGCKDKKQYKDYSTGMKMKQCLAVALSHHPKLLLLDEATSGLDPVVRELVKKLLVDFVAENGASVMIASHNLRELEDVCDHVGILNKGRVLLERSLSDLQDNTVKLQVAYQGVTEPPLPAELNILHRSHVGRVYTYIVRGSSQEIMRRMQITEPVLLESIPLTLEEIFIYELGGVDYAAKDILL